MTSPTQLKYLEAMGIPVWVSRELVIKEESLEVVENEALPCADSALDILQSLENQKGSTQVSSNNSEKTVVPSVSEQPQKGASEARSSTPFQQQQIQQNEIGRTPAHIIYASGSLEADWVVIGQSPDGSESSTNQPYPYDSGELLNNMLSAVGINQPRVDSYWINVLKSPLSLEDVQISSAATELNMQLTEIILKIKPKMVLIVGQVAAQNLLQTKEPLARIRMKQHKEQQLSLVTELKIPSIVTYYPSYLLSKPQDKAKAWEDLKLAMKELTRSE